MSRIGIKPISVPAGVEVTIADGNVVTAKGPKGTLTKTMHKDMIIKAEGGVVTVERPSEDKLHKSLHGLTRTLVSNMVEGVANGFSKKLEIVGVGYRAQKQGKNLVMNLGFSHQVIFSETDTIKLEVPDPNHIVVTGCDKQEVGQFACEIREKRPPEPYKGKGIRYEGEYVIRKEGKAGKGAKK
ncbi:MAG: 50S ribosomal protein L6 [Ruminococcus sp.]|nr:50S ribosomal protein L6 [Ruminococcus sp.]